MAAGAGTVLKGHCLCGACRFVLAGPHNWVGHCHCDSCRRATASPMTTWIGQENGTWQMTGDAPQTYRSSAGVERGCCGTCGSPLYFRAERYPNEVHFYAALLENPEAVLPEAQYHAAERIAWMHLADALPCP